jgi:hypothetical protein
MNTRDDVRYLIQEYQKAAMELTALMQETYGVQDLFLAYRNAELPLSGVLQKPDKGTYKFHGGGCYLKLGRQRVDIDFGPNGAVDGFEAGKLLRFSQETLNSNLFTYESLRNALREMLEGGELVYPEAPPNRQLYFWAVPVQRNPS